jgi:hypothetical protein
MPFLIFATLSGFKLRKIKSEETFLFSRNYERKNLFCPFFTYTVCIKYIVTYYRILVFKLFFENV